MRRKNERLHSASERFEKIFGSEATQNVVMPLMKEILKALENLSANEDPTPAIDIAEKRLWEFRNVLEEKQGTDVHVWKHVFLYPLLEALDTRNAMSENAIKDLQKNLTNIKVKTIKSRSLENLVYNATKNMVTGYIRKGAGDDVSIEREEPLATNLTMALQKLADDTDKEVTTQTSLSAYVGSGREVAREVFNNPERLWFYAGYLICPRNGYPDPKKGKHDALINLTILRALFVKLYEDKKDVRDLNIAQIDILIEKMTQHESTSGNKVVPNEDSVTEKESSMECEVAPAPVEEEVEKENIFKQKDKKMKKKQKKLSRQEEAANALEAKKKEFDVFINQARTLLSPIQTAIHHNKNVYTLSSKELEDLKAARKLCVDSLAYYDRSFSPVQDMIEEIDRLTKLSPNDIDQKTGRRKGEIF